MKRFGIRLLPIVVACSIGISAQFPSQQSFAADGERKSALQQQLELVDRLRHGKANADLADALYDVAAKYNHSGDNVQALDYLNQSLAVEQQLKRPKTQLNTLVEIGNVELSMNKVDDALAAFQRALQFAQANLPKDGVGDAYNSIATSFIKAGKYDDAEKYLKQGLDAVSTSNGEIRASLLVNLASIQRATGRNSEALETLKKAAELGVQQQNKDDFQTGDSDDIHLRTLANLAAFQHDVGQYSESIATYRRLAELADSMLDPCQKAVAFWGTAENEFEQQKLTDALKDYKSAVEATKDCKSNPEIAISSLIGLGSAYAALEQVADAERYHKQALSLADEESNVQQQVDALTQLGNDYLIKGAPEKALFALQEATKRLPKVGYSPVKQKAQLFTTIGRCYRALGETAAAQGYYQEALSLYKSVHEPEYELNVLNNLATLYLDSYDMPSFQKTYARVKEVLANSKDSRQKAIATYTLGQSQLMQSQYAAAIDSFNAALSAAQQSGDVSLQSAILRGMGLAQFFKGDYNGSIGSYDSALKLANGSTSIETQWDCNLGLGKSYKALHQFDKAEQHLLAAAKVVEQERMGLSRDTFKTHNLDFRSDSFIELVDLYYLMNKPEQALEVAERGKARAFLDLLANKQERRVDSGTNGGAPVQSQVISLRAGEEGSRSVSVAPRASEAVEETAVSPIYSEAPSIAEIKTLVQKQGNTCLEYMVTGDKLYIWIVDPNGTVHMPAPVGINSELKQIIQDTAKAISETPKTPADAKTKGAQRQADLKKLYALLVKPVEALLPKEKGAIVTIVPHRILFSVPFAALMADDGSYLVEKHTLNYLPAIGVLRGTQQADQQNGVSEHRLVAFGNPITREISFLGALPYAEKEVKHIAQLYGPEKVTIEVGADATKRKFVELVASGATEIHLATHGLVDEDHPMHSAVVLAPNGADDGLLSVRDILLLKNLKAKLVVLSACQTGRGKITGDGVVGLSRAFMIAGTPSVLVSQWNVDDIMTEYQMTQFYKSYLKGADKAKALRDAQLSTISFMESGNGSKTDPNYVRANPRFWAAFQLIGSQ